MSSSPIKITVNKPAAEAVFRDAPAVRFSIEDGLVRVCGAGLGNHGDSAKVEPRQMGGFSLVVEGDLADRVRALLNPTSDEPFYLLEAAEDGWFNMRHRRGPVARHIPWMRIWRRIDTPEVEAPELTPATLGDALRDAETIMKGYSKGRPTTEVSAARDLLLAFRKEAERIAEHDLAALLGAANLIEEYLHDRTQMRRTTSIDTNTVRAAVRIAEHSQDAEVQTALINLVVTVSRAEKQALKAAVREGEARYDASRTKAKLRWP